MLAAHADWSVDAGKRWFVSALKTSAGWRLESPAPVGEVTTFCARLLAASGGRVALGVDLPLGLPQQYVREHVQCADFTSFLRSLPTDSRFFEVCEDLSQIGPDRPFYPRRGIKGMTRAAHAAALDLPDSTAISRLCDRATATRPAGAPLFWTLGANQTGKAAIAAWRDWLGPELRGAKPPALWPFMGDFKALLAEHAMVIAETYPAEALRHLGLRLAGSKRRQSDRVALAAPVLAALHDLNGVPTEGLRRAIMDGFGADAAGEDRFDALVGVLGVINVLEGRRTDGIPDDPWLRRWEGWVLGQTDLPNRL